MQCSLYQTNKPLERQKNTANIFVHYFILCISLLISASAFSQNKKNALSGTIQTIDGNPIENAVISLEKNKVSTTTNRDGYFLFKNLTILKDSITVSGNYTKKLTLPVHISNAENNLGTMLVSYSAQALPIVEVKGRKLQSYKSNYNYFGLKMQSSVLDLPQSISTVTKELIKDKMQYSLKDITTDVAGVNAYSGFDEYTIRGFRAENARTFNGLRGYNSTFVSPMLVNVERIEILKGPAATLYGNGDPGGSINLVSKKPLAESRKNISIFGGSWDHWRALADITGPVTKDQKLLYRFNAGYDRTKSFRDNQFNRSFELAPSISYMPNSKLKFNVDFSVSHVSTVLDRGVPGLENDYNLKHVSPKLSLSQPGDYLKETDIATSAYGSYQITKSISFNSGYMNYLSRQRTAEHGFQSYITPDTVGLYYTKWNYNTSTNNFTNYFRIHTNTGAVSHEIIAGWDYIQTSAQRADQNRYEDPALFGDGSGIVQAFSLLRPNYIRPNLNTYQLSDVDNESNEVDGDFFNTQGIYIQEMLSWKNWKLLAGLRREFYRGVADDDDDNDGDDEDDDDDGASNGMVENVWLPKLSLSYALRNNVSVYVSYNKGFDPFEASSSLQIFKNPFKPILSELYEAGVKASLLQNKILATLAVYRLNVKNTAVNANDPSNPDLYEQHGEDRSSGVELEVNGNILPNLSVSVNYAYNIAKVHQSDVPEEIGTFKENAPKNASNSWIKYTLPSGLFQHLSFMLGHSQVGMRHTLDNNLQLPAYVVFNGGLQYTWKHFDWHANLNNIFNKTYWESAYNNINKWPGRPRNFMIGFGYNF